MESVCRQIRAMQARAEQAQERSKIFHCLLRQLDAVTDAQTVGCSWAPFAVTGPPAEQDPPPLAGDALEAEPDTAACDRRHATQQRKPGCQESQQSDFALLGLQNVTDEMIAEMDASCTPERVVGVKGGGGSWKCSMMDFQSSEPVDELLDCRAQARNALCRTRTLLGAHAGMPVDAQGLQMWPRHHMTKVFPSMSGPTGLASAPTTRRCSENDALCVAAIGSGSEIEFHDLPVDSQGLAMWPCAGGPVARRGTRVGVGNRSKRADPDSDSDSDAESAVEPLMQYEMEGGRRVRRRRR
jgi:hypothetical protein